MNNAAIKALAAERGCRVADLVALAPQNDMLYAGSPGQVEEADWFAAPFERLGCGQGVHLRRIRYRPRAAGSRTSGFQVDPPRNYLGPGWRKKVG